MRDAIGARAETGRRCEMGDGSTGQEGEMARLCVMCDMCDRATVRPGPEGDTHHGAARSKQAGRKERPAKRHTGVERTSFSGSRNLGSDSPDPAD